ncbi:MAG: hypothetical protein HQL04_04745 [Nitrospirae bacterium]|nr:hypothetical protein [Nitrospirota bacterium]
MGGTRRELLLLLVAATGAYFFETLSPISNHIPPPPVISNNGSRECPLLKADVTVENMGELVMIQRRQYGQPVTFMVNLLGARIVELLRGNLTIEEISDLMSRQTEIRRSEVFDAKVACFVAEIGKLGFLEKPFYVKIIEEYKVSYA